MRLRAAALFLLPVLLAAPAPAQAQAQVSPGWLGIVVEGEKAVPPEIVEVVPGSPAQRAGLRVGDLIVRVNGKDAGDIDVFTKMVQGMRAGAPLEIAVKRGGATHELRCVLGTRPGETAEKKVEPPSRTLPTPQKAAVKQKGMLGVQLAEEDGRVSIASVVPESPAAKGGLKGGDVVLTAQGKNVGELEDFVARVQGVGAGNVLALVVARGDRKMEFKIKLAAQLPMPGGAAVEPPVEVKPARPVRPAPAAKIEWMDNLERAQAIAKRDGRPVLIDFSASWCKPCKMLDQSFAASDVKELLARCVPVKIDVDAQSRLADRFGVSTIPHVVVLGADGRKKGEFTGYLPATALAARLGEWLGGQEAPPPTPDRRAVAARRDAEKRAQIERDYVKATGEAQKAREKAQADAAKARAAAARAARGAREEGENELRELEAVLRELKRELADLRKRLEALEKGKDSARR